MPSKGSPRFSPRSGDRRGQRQLTSRPGSSLWYGLAFLLLLGLVQMYYVTPAGRYCAITGGRYTVVTEGVAGETGVCSLPGGKACAAAAYYAGTCSR